MTRFASEAEQRWWCDETRRHAEVKQELEDELSRFQLGSSSYAALEALDDAGGKLRMQELARLTGAGQSSTTRQADRLEKSGLVERGVCASDGRGVTIALTTEGRERLREVRPHYRVALAAGLDRLGHGKQGEFMRAVTMSAFGGPEVLAVAELPIGEPGPGEVRIRVAAAAINPADLLLRSGAVAAYVADLDGPYVPGMDAAGVIDAVGAGVDWRVGEQVMAVVNPFRAEGGAQAETVVVPADSIARVPDGLSMAEAATLPMNGLTALQALALADLPAGATVAVTGASGVLGGYVVQLAKYRGLRVVADAPGEADVVVARGQFPSGMDGLIDTAVLGAEALPFVRDGGVFVKVRPYDFETARGVVVERANVLAYEDKDVALNELALLAEKGVVTVRVAATFPPEQAADAHWRQEAGGLRGRQVIVF